MNLQAIVEATIDDLQKAFVSGELTAKNLTLLYLNRIAAYDQEGAGLHSVIQLNPDALQIAEALDTERAVNGPRGPLHGIPVLLKDNIDTGDKMPTSAGSLSLANSFALQDAFIAKQLRKAGAVILGKTNLTEFANFMTEKMPNGFSSRGGQTLNPYGPGKFNVGGSSAGSGSAIAANLAVVAVGTETDGSILNPSSANSLVGIKPTVGLISRTGIIPISISQDTAGPMARTVTDAAILLGALTGTDENDPATFTSMGRGYTDYTSFLDRNGLQGARIGIARPVYYDECSKEQLDLMNNAIDQMAAEGVAMIDPVPIPTASEEWDHNVLIFEFKPALNAYLSKLPPQTDIRSLRDIVAFNRQHAENCLRYGQLLLEKCEATSGSLTDPAYIRSRTRDLQWSQTEGIDLVMREHQLDALLFPADFASGITARAGYPAITVPAGYTPEGEPFGITFAGKAYSEPTLLRLAFAYEQATKHRVPPSL